MEERRCHAINGRQHWSCVRTRWKYKGNMRPGAGTLLAAIWLLAGCRTAHEVATTSYQNAAAQPQTSTVTTTTTGVPPTVTASTGALTEAQPATTRPPPDTGTSTYTEQRSAAPETKTKTASPNTTPSQLQFPTATPVEGKPGYVYSPSDPTKYVDVSGYAPGSKVKDPYSGKIFLVP